MKRGDWMQTRSGEQFYPLDPEPNKIHIEDIAHALSMSCRFGGHVKKFYSVAEHSIWVSGFVDPKNALAGLMHDAAEAYLSDIIRPVKRQLPEYGRLEDRLLSTIFDRFGIDYPYSENVKSIDYRACYTEGIHLMFDVSVWIEKDRETPLPFEPKNYNPALGKKLFLNRFRALTK